MGLFTTRSDVLATKLKARTRQLETMTRMSKVRDQCTNTQDFINKAAEFMGTELVSRFVAIVLKQDETSNIVASTIPEVAEANNQLILDLVQGAINARKDLVINNTRGHQRLRAAKVACVAVKPLWLKDQYIGAIVVFRFKRLIFAQRSLHTLTTLAEQFPAALDYVAAGENVSQKNKELKIIYDVDKIREKHSKDTQTLLDGLSELIKNSTSAKGAYIAVIDKKMVLNKAGVVGTATAHKPLLEKFARDAIAEGEMISKVTDGPLRECICVPAVIGEEHAAFIMVNSSNPPGFSEEDKRILSAISKQADNALFEDRERKKVRDVFGRYVSPELLEIILNDPNALRTERHEVTMLFSDLRGFTSLSEKIEPERVVTMLNEYFQVMTDIILKNKGAIDKFVGDEIVAMFGAPVYFEDHCKRAVKTGIEMQHAFRELKTKWKKQGIEVGMGVGIDSGNVIVGNIGSETRVDYTAIGDHVNTAARLCASAADNQVLITQGTHDQVHKSVIARELPALTLKGKALPVKVYNAVSIR